MILGLFAALTLRRRPAAPPTAVPTDDEILAAS
jgi:hypothetical protein